MSDERSPSPAPLEDAGVETALQRLVAAAGYVDEELLARIRELSADHERLLRENRRLRSRPAAPKTDHASTRLRDALRE